MKNTVQIRSFLQSVFFVLLLLVILASCSSGSIPKIEDETLKLIKSDDVEQFKQKIDHKYYESFLFHACTHDAAEITKYIIHCGININHTNSAKLTPLMSAAQNNSHNVLQILIDAGADINYQDTKRGWDALMYASEKNAKASSEILMKASIDKNHTDKEKANAFIIAARNNAKDVLGVLIVSGIEINSSDKNGRNALLAALDAKRPYVKKSTLKATRNSKSKKNSDIRDVAVQNLQKFNNLNREICEFLIQSGINIHHQDNAGWNALMFASKHDMPEIASILIKSGINVNHRDKNGRTAYMIAYRSSPKIAEILVTAGAELNLRIPVYSKSWTETISESLAALFIHSVL